MSEFKWGEITVRPMTKEEKLYHESGEWKKNTPLDGKWEHGEEYNEVRRMIEKLSDDDFCGHVLRSMDEFKTGKCKECMLTYNI